MNDIFKKIILVLSVMCLMICLSACSKDEKQEETVAWLSVRRIVCQERLSGGYPRSTG